MDARDKLGIPWQYSENEKHGMFLLAFENKAGLPVEPATFQLYVPALSALWRDSGIREAFSRRSEFQLVSEPSPRLHDRDFHDRFGLQKFLKNCQSTGKLQIAVHPNTQHHEQQTHWRQMKLSKWFSRGNIHSFWLSKYKEYKVLLKLRVTQGA